MVRKKKEPRLNDQPPEVIEAQFLQEHPDFEKLEAATKVGVFREIPKSESIVFLNNKDPGVPLEFHYCTATHPLHHYKLFHGHQYDLPVEVIRHLEGENPRDLHSCQLRTYTMKRDEYGITKPVVSGYVPYFQCRTVRA